ncbi:MAG: hypothetical protein EBV83_00070 [Verrucomicrobia bacterium]|nr:hypothetical protein [Verrucomicrobiota bacterium]
MGLLIPLFLWVAIPAVLFAPPLPLRSLSSPTESNPVTPTPAPAQEVRESEEEEEIRKPVEEKVVRATLPAAHTPAKHGETDGESWVAQRTMVEDYCGWGWIKKDKESWRQARWVALEGTAGICPLPHTFLPRPEDDKNYQYRFYGTFAPYRAYEPQADVWVDVFILKGFMSLGPAKEEIRRPPPAQASSGVNRFAERGANFR